MIKKTNLKLDDVVFDRSVYEIGQEILFISPFTSEIYSGTVSAIEVGKGIDTYYLSDETMIEVSRIVKRKDKFSRRKLF